MATDRDNTWVLVGCRINLEAGIEVRRRGRKMLKQFGSFVLCGHRFGARRIEADFGGNLVVPYSIARSTESWMRFTA